MTASATKTADLSPFHGKAMPLLLVAITVASGCGLTPTSFTNVQEVDRLCAKDGGIRVYEQVTLPANRFHQAAFGTLEHGLIRREGRLGEKALGPEFRYVSESKNIPASGGAHIQRVHTSVWRVTDEKLLGDATDYTYASGEATTPFRTAHSCTAFNGKLSSTALLKSVFGQEVGK